MRRLKRKQQTFDSVERFENFKNHRVQKRRFYDKKLGTFKKTEIRIFKHKA